jgi:glycosyltransferase involved in cell wall biosynthesis
VTKLDLRIALVGPLPPPAGGMANQTRQLAELLGAEGATVEIVQVNRPYSPTWIGRIRGLRAVFRLVPYMWRLASAARRADILHVMANSGWSWHLFAAPAVLIGRLFGVSVVVNYRGGEAETFLAVSAHRVLPTLRRTQALVVPSGYLENVFARHGMASRVIANIIDLARFRPDIADKRAFGPHIVITRNLEPIYDIACAIRAFARLRETVPTATMSVAGSGPERQALETLSVELGVGDAITFTGRLDRDAIAELYRRSDIALNPTRVDNMPNSVLEAMASGLPVVSTDVGGVPFILEHERTGLLVPAGDDCAMAAALQRLSADIDLRRRLAAAGLEEASRYAWPRVREQWLALYAECGASRSRSAAGGAGGVL